MPRTRRAAGAALRPVEPALEPGDRRARPARPDAAPARNTAGMSPNQRIERRGRRTSSSSGSWRPGSVIARHHAAAGGERRQPMTRNGGAALRPRQPRRRGGRRVRVAGGGAAPASARATISPPAISNSPRPTIRDGLAALVGARRAAHPRGAGHAVRREPRQKRPAVGDQQLRRRQPRHRGAAWPRSRDRPEAAQRRRRPHRRGDAAERR